ncbi:hypothetical protein J7K03_01055 [bacterium]|nr:hypothetical protein [bacterium]
MKERNFYFKYFLPRIEIWAFLCGLFGFFFILAHADFESPDVEKIFIFLWLYYLLCSELFRVLFNGGARLLKLKMEQKNARIINSYIVNGHIDPSLTNQQLEELFCVLKKEPITNLINSLIYGGAVIVLTTLTMAFLKTSRFNLIVIVVGGLIYLAFVALFSIFSVEAFFINDLLRECRKILSKRGIKPREEMELFSLENRFHYFIFLLFLITIILLSFVPPSQLSLFLITLSCLAFVMIAIIGRMLFSSIYSVFEEIKEFVARLPQEKKAQYFTGSSYKEVLALSKDLNRSAEEIFRARERERKTKKELEEKVEELNKWFKLTVGRELKMIELKKEIERLKKEKKNNNNQKT